MTGFQNEPDDVGPTVFLGGASDMLEFLEQGVSAAVLANPSLGLYGHTNGVFQAVGAGDMTEIAALFSQRGSGVSEIGGQSGYASGQITIANQTAQTQFLYVGTTFAAGNGSIFQLANNVNDAPITYDPMKGQYFYTLLAGTSYTLQTEAVSLGTATNIAANQIRSFVSPSSLSIMSSSAMSGGNDWSNVSDNGLLQTNLDGDGTYSTSPGFLTTSFAEYTTLFTAQGFTPAETDVNVPDTFAWTSNDLQSWKAYVDNARSLGIMNVAPIFADSGYSADLNIPFAISPWYATLRQAALYSGGLSFDVPPDYAFLRNPTYLVNLVQQIQWATDNGLRSSLIISQGAVNDPANNQDANLLANTQKLVAYLEANNALPSQFIVENYDLDGTGNQLDTPTANSLVSVANYLSGLHLTPTNSESGLEVAGSNKAADMIIVGQAPSEQVTSVVNPLAQDSLFGMTGGQRVSVTVSLSAAGLGTLSSAAGIADGAAREITLAGTPAQLTALLRSLTFRPDANVSGAVTIDVSATDANGSIAASTVLDVATLAPAAPAIDLGLQTLVLDVSEDKWTQDAQFTVSVDGVQAGGTYTATALHALGQSQDIAVTDDFGGGAHTVSVNFLNDIWGGTALEDTNLYVNAITLGGVTTTENNEQLCAGTAQYNLAPTAAQIVGAGSANTATASSTPTLRGVGVAGDVVTVTATRGGSSAVLGTTTADADGNWSLTAPVLADGSYQISATQADSLGSVSPTSAARTLVVDTHVPAAPEMTPGTSLSTSATPTWTGTAEAGAAVTVMATQGGSSVVVGTTIASQTGGWSLTSSEALPDGIYQIDATQRDAVGTLSTASAAQALVVDTHVPAAPVIGLAVDTLTLDVSADWWQQPAQFTVSVDGQQVGGVYSTAALKSQGQSQDIALQGAFGTGAHVVSVNFLNDIWGGSAATDTNLYVNAITLDGVTTTENSAQLWAGAIRYDLAPVAEQVTVTGPATFATSSSTPTLRGTGMAGGVVTVTAAQGGLNGGPNGGPSTVLGTAIVGADGSWSLTPATALADGSHQITATQADSLGTASAASATQTLVVDTQAPAAPTIGLALDTLTLNVSADWWQQPAGFTVSVDGHRIGTTNWVSALKDAGQSQTVTLTGSFGSGPHVVTVDFLNDIYGGTHATDTNLYVNAITLDGVTTTENSAQLWAGGINYALPAASADGTNSVTGTFVTDQSRPVGQGLAAPNAQVIVSGTADGQTAVLGSTTADANGLWSFSLDHAVANGTYQVSAVQVNAAGDRSVPSATETFIVDAGSPSAAAAIAAGTAPIPSVFGTGTMTFVTSDMIIGVANGATLTDAGSNNLFVLGASGAASIGGNVMTNGDTFDLRSALTAAHWDGAMGDIGSYLGSSVVNGGQDLQVSVHASGGASILQLTLPGQEAATLATFMQHALLH